MRQKTKFLLFILHDITFGRIHDAVLVGYKHRKFPSIGLGTCTGRMSKYKIFFIQTHTYRTEWGHMKLTE